MQVNHEITSPYEFKKSKILSAHELEIEGSMLSENIVKDYHEHFENNSHDKGEEIPNYLTCPITHLIMFDPVYVGKHSFEREALEEYIGLKGECPITRAKISFKDINTNNALNEAKEYYLDKNPHARYGGDLYISMALQKSAMLSCKDSDIKALRIIIQEDRRLLIQPCFGEGSFLLHVACAFGNRKLVQTVFSWLEIAQPGLGFKLLFEKNHDGMTPFDLSIKNQCDDVAKWVGQLTPEKTIITTLDAISENNIDKFKLGLRLGAPLDWKDQRGNTLLHIVLERGLSDFAQLLLSDQDMNKREENAEGNNPLHLAVMSECVDIIPLLVSHGIPYKKKNRQGKSALDLSRGESERVLKEAIERMKATKLDSRLSENTSFQGLQTSLNDQTTELNRHDELMREQQDEITKLSSAIDEVHKALMDNKANSQKSFGQLSMCLTNLEKAQRKALEKEEQFEKLFEDMSEKVETCNTRLNRHYRNFKVLFQKTKKLTETADDLSVKLNEANDKIDQQAHQIQTLEGTLEKLSSLPETLATLTEEVESLTKKVSEQDTKTREIKNNQTYLKARLQKPVIPPSTKTKEEVDPRERLLNLLKSRQAMSK